MNNRVINSNNNGNIMKVIKRRGEFAGPGLKADHNPTLAPPRRMLSPTSGANSITSPRLDFKFAINVLFLARSQIFHEKSAQLNQQHELHQPCNK